MILRIWNLHEDPLSGLYEGVDKEICRQHGQRFSKGVDLQMGWALPSLVRFRHSSMAGGSLLSGI